METHEQAYRVNLGIWGGKSLRGTELVSLDFKKIAPGKSKQNCTEELNNLGGRTQEEKTD